MEAVCGLNKTCLKDSFSLPKIKQLVDAMTGHQLLSFIDAYSSITKSKCMKQTNKKNFTIDRGLYCYKVTSFGLKNASTTYQYLMNKMFADHIRKTLEVYMDSILIKSMQASDQLVHFEKMFSILPR